MSFTIKLPEASVCRGINKRLRSFAITCSVLCIVRTIHGQIANTPPTDLFDIQIGLRPEKHQVGFSADYLSGYGQLSLPFGFAIGKNGQYAIGPSVDLKDRDSTYYGGTLSYSYGQAWFFDFSYSQGTSTADTKKKLVGITFPVKYEIDDQWYQLYVRYAFPQLRGERYSAYIRVGGTYVDATLSAAGQNDSLAAKYEQNTGLTDFEANLGIGIGYSVFSGQKARLSAFAEAEGFAGTREQNIQEKLSQAGNPAPGSPFEDKLENLIYGALGRFSLRFEFFPGERRRLRISADVGVQFRYTVIEYDQARGIPNLEAQSIGETLWGPFVKFGLRYSF